MHKIPLFIICILLTSVLLSACEVNTGTTMIKSQRRLEKYFPKEQEKPQGVIDLSEGPRLRYDAKFGPQDLNFDIKIVDPY